MPEGPEVEVVRRGLSEVIGDELMLFEVANHKKYRQLQRYISVLEGYKLSEITRRGKFLIWEFTKKNSILYGLNHLGMTGVWYLFSQSKWEDEIKKPSKFKHYKLHFQFSSGLHLLFIDARTFGRYEIYEDKEIFELPQIKYLGPDILDDNFDVVKFTKRIRGIKNNRVIEIGKALLDPKVASGCGNIYKNEALFIAKINPFTRVNLLSDAEIQNLAYALIEVGKKALLNKGTTFRDYMHVDGYSGLMQNHLMVYGKDSQPCPNCKSIIESGKQGDRTSFWCNHCQPLR